MLEKGDYSKMRLEIGTSDGVVSKALKIYQIKQSGITGIGNKLAEAQSTAAWRALAQWSHLLEHLQRSSQLDDSVLIYRAVDQLHVEHGPLLEYPCGTQLDLQPAFCAQVCRPSSSDMSGRVRSGPAGNAHTIT